MRRSAARCSLLNSCWAPGPLPSIRPSALRSLPLRLVAHDLESDTINPSRFAPAVPVVNRRQRQKAPDLSAILACPRETPKRVAFEVRTQIDCRRHRKLPSACGAESDQTRFGSPPRESALAGFGISPGFVFVEAERALAQSADAVMPISHAIGDRVVREYGLSVDARKSVGDWGIDLRLAFDVAKNYPVRRPLGMDNSEA